ncbi:MAG: dihydroorotase [Chitinophagaceae bacterium]
MKNYLIKNIAVVNEGAITVADVLIENKRIAKIAPIISSSANAIEINGEGKHLFPGVIDDQVHFREPGLTHKANIYSEAKAAVAGGVTSYMEMPNTIPNATNLELLEQKYQIAANNSLGNYSFYMGTSNTSADDTLKVNDHKNDICGIKIFMGASTGNMLVDNYITLDKVFRESEILIATHCECEPMFKKNYAKCKAEKGIIEPADHPIIRDAAVCFESSLAAVQFAKKYDSRLHILHITTAKELDLFTNMLPLKEKRITSEVCVHHLHFTSNDYATLGNLIKCNPAIKAPENKEALWKALLDDRIDVIATDHAPHTWEEKTGDYDHAHAGLPLVQHPLLLMLHYYKEGRISLEKIAEKMSHAVAECFQISERGYIREGYYADLVVVDLNQQHTVTKQNLLYYCGWSPLEGFTFPATITHSFVSGHLAYKNGIFDESEKGMRMRFHR